MIRAGLIALALLSASGANAACRQALALGIDVSGSVDAREYRQQLDGIAWALQAPEVAAVLLAQPQAPVALAVYEWSAADYQRQIVGWTLIDGPAALASVAGRVAATDRARAPYSTGIGAAVAHGGRLMDRAPACWQYTLDISGDGKNNDGPDPRSVRDGPGLGALTVNALVIGVDNSSGLYIYDAEIAEMVSYFRAKVIRGPDAFVEVALGYGEYAEAMKRKLLRELTGLVVAQGR